MSGTDARARISSVDSASRRGLLREDTIRDAVNEWFAELFHRDHVDKTVAALVASQDGAGQKVSGREAAEHRLAKAEAEIRRFQAAIAAGIDPTALVEAINSAQAERAAAQAEINNTPALNLMEAAEVRTHRLAGGRARDYEPRE